MIVVADATPLIALAKIGKLHLLQELFGAVFVPSAVYHEVAGDTAQRPGAIEVRNAPWIDVRLLNDPSRVAYLFADLDSGEAEALVLAVEMQADWVLLDEVKARLSAGLLGLKCMGTLGVLLLAKKQGKLSAIRPCLDALRANRFHVSEKVCRAVLRQAGE